VGIFGRFRKKSQNPVELDPKTEAIVMMLFPGGAAQAGEENAQLHALLRGRLTRDESISLLMRVKLMLLHADDKSEKSVIKYILEETQGKLTAHEAKLACQFFTGYAGNLYSGGDGTSPEEAVVINATSSLVGVRAEYDWIEKKYGKRDVDWTMSMQSHGTGENGIIWDSISIRLADGTGVNLYFDISSYYGRS